MRKADQESRRTGGHRGENAFHNPSLFLRALIPAARLSRGGGGRKGRGATFTSENLLRALIVHTLEGDDLRGTIVRIADSPFLQDFLRLGNRRVMDFTFLDRAFGAVRPETWKRINAALARSDRARAVDPLRRRPRCASTATSDCLVKLPKA